MDTFHFGEITVRGFILMGLVLVAAIALFRLTKQIVVTVVVTTLALGGVAYLLGIVSFDKAKAAAGDASETAKELGAKASELGAKASGAVKAFEEHGAREK